jgi:hypothetical protein
MIDRCHDLWRQVVRHEKDYATTVSQLPDSPSNVLRCPGIKAACGLVKKQDPYTLGHQFLPQIDALPLTT